MPDKAVRMWPRTSSEEASRHVEERWTDQQSSRQHNIGCITMTFSVQYSTAGLPACWYVGEGDCGTMRTRRVLQSKYYTREYCCHDKTEEEGDGEGWVMTERQFCSWRKEEGLSICRVRRKRGIIDESAAYNFQRRIKQAVKLHCTACSDGVRPSMR